MTLLIKAPLHFYPEVAYTVDIILKHLGLPYTIEKTERLNLDIQLNNKKNIIFELPFFMQTSPESYITASQIPKNISFIKTPLSPEKDLPILFGIPSIDCKKETITFHADIIASTFFMLSRWEEIANKTRDSHNRFPAYASLSKKHHILDRPIVNEYIETIWSALQELGYTEKRLSPTFTFIPTHDIDHIRFWKSLPYSILILGSSLIKQKNIRLFFKRLALFFNFWIRRKKDPYNNLDSIMDLSDSYKLKSRFYFMSGGRTRFDNNYRIEDAKQMINHILSRKHIVGFHPSYDAYNDAKQWIIEKNRLTKVAQSPIIEGREHYLRFEVPTTWQIWEDHDMREDLTLSYADDYGFRCGTANSFPVFNCKTRKKLKLIETPLILMDTTLIFYKKHTLNEAFKKTKEYIAICKKYGMPLTYLAHNSMFLVDGFYAHYESVLKESQ
jgi:hypothetical protein